ncbi:MAG: hypothetical protein OHK0024_24610 [Thalassobaculales bacterium]
MRKLLQAIILAGLAAAAMPAAAAEGRRSLLVLGDSLASGLGLALRGLAAREGDVRVVIRAQPGTGLARSDVLDWPQRLAEILARERFDAAVILIGSNDRQSIFFRDRRPLHWDTPSWKAQYAARIDTMIRILKDAGAMVVWVGLPVMRHAGYSAAMGDLSALFRERAAAACAAFVDLAALTAGPDGAFTAEIADADGEPRLARAGDGVHFTVTGYRIAAAAVIEALRHDVVACAR